MVFYAVQFWLTIPFHVKRTNAAESITNLSGAVLLFKKKGEKWPFRQIMDELLYIFFSVKWLLGSFRLAFFKTNRVSPMMNDAADCTLQTLHKHKNT